MTDLLSKLFLAILLLGEVLNVGRFIMLDFNAPYKAEVGRAVGFFVPMGGVVGYWTFEEEQ